MPVSDSASTASGSDLSGGVVQGGQSAGTVPVAGTPATDQSEAASSVEATVHSSGSQTVDPREDVDAEQEFDLDGMD